jgi:hypothetical protein
MLRLEAKNQKTSATGTVKNSLCEGTETMKGSETLEEIEDTGTVVLAVRSRIRGEEAGTIY